MSWRVGGTVFSSAVLAWLVLVTAHSGWSSFRGLVPLDARTGLAVTRPEAMFEYPFSAIAIEPFMGLARAIVGAPDYRIAAVSLIVWSGIVAFVVGLWRAGGGGTLRRWIARVLNGLAMAVLSILVFTIYGLFLLLLPQPDKSLSAKDPSFLVVDLHSHTILSADGFATVAQNVSYHRAGGYRVIALTEHYSNRWRASDGSDDRSIGGGAITVLRGVELGISGFSRQEIWLVALRVRPEPDFPYPLAAGKNSEAAIRKLIEFVHKEEGGVVIALSYRLRPEDVERLAILGVDGFEIANFGHPIFDQSVRDALLQAQEKHRLALVANSDWHGWGGSARTWTLMKVNDAGSEYGDQVINALRQRDPDRIIPVVSQMMGRPSLLRGVFAPVAEIIRYSGELTLPQVVSWWVWGIGSITGFFLMRRIDLAPGCCFLATFLIVAAAGLLLRGSELVTLWYGGTPFMFPARIGAAAIAAGIMALLLAAALLRGSFRKTVIE